MGLWLQRTPSFQINTCNEIVEGIRDFWGTDLYSQLQPTSQRERGGVSVPALWMMQCTRLQLQLWIG